VQSAWKLLLPLLFLLVIIPCAISRAAFRTQTSTQNSGALDTHTLSSKEKQLSNAYVAFGRYHFSFGFIRPPLLCLFVRLLVWSFVYSFAFVFVFVLFYMLAPFGGTPANKQR
jgi:hypothetical protein